MPLKRASVALQRTPTVWSISFLGDVFKDKREFAKDFRLESSTTISKIKQCLFRAVSQPIKSILKRTLCLLFFDECHRSQLVKYSCKILRSSL